MTTKVHAQPFGNYPENFDKREARAAACCWSLVQLAATETYAMATTDSFTHATMAGSSGTTTLKLPLAAASTGRIVNVYASSVAGTVLVQTSTGGAVATITVVGAYAYFCNGTTWVQVG